MGLFNFSRLSFKRLFINFRYFRFLIKTKPDINIICTHELIKGAVWYKIFFGGVLIYDVQENYFRNINNTSTFPIIIRNVVALGVRLKETLSRPFMDHYFLAEKVYQYQCLFTKEKSTVIKNKYLGTLDKHRNTKSVIPDGKIRLLYTGTIAKEYGIYDAIHLTDQLHDINPNIELIIAGYCAKHSVLKKVFEKINRKDYIELIGGSKPIPHTQIIELMGVANFALLPYEDSPAFEGKFPTKVYECIAQKLPLIISAKYEWNDFIERNNCGIIHSLRSGSANELYHAMKTEKFYNVPLKDNILWETQAVKLTEFFESHPKIASLLK